MTTWLLGASILVFCILAWIGGSYGIGFGMITIFFSILTALVYEKRYSKSNGKS